MKQHPPEWLIGKYVLCLLPGYGEYGGILKKVFPDCATIRFLDGHKRRVPWSRIRYVEYRKKLRPLSQCLIPEPSP